MTNIRTGGTPGKTDTVHALASPMHRGQESRPVEKDVDGEPVLLAPNEIIINAKDAKKHLEPLVDEASRTGTVSRQSLARHAVPVVKSLVQPKGLCAGGKKGMENGGVVPMPGSMLRSLYPPKQEMPFDDKSQESFEDGGVVQAAKRLATPENIINGMGNFGSRYISGVGMALTSNPVGKGSDMPGGPETYFSENGIARHEKVLRDTGMESGGVIDAPTNTVAYEAKAFSKPRLGRRAFEDGGEIAVSNPSTGIINQGNSGNASTTIGEGVDPRVVSAVQNRYAQDMATGTNAAGESLTNPTTANAKATRENMEGMHTKGGFSLTQMMDINKGIRDRNADDSFSSAKTNSLTPLFGGKGGVTYDAGSPNEKKTAFSDADSTTATPVADSTMATPVAAATPVATHPAATKTIRPVSQAAQGIVKNFRPNTPVTPSAMPARESVMNFEKGGRIKLLRPKGFVAGGAYYTPSEMKEGLAEGPEYFKRAEAAAPKEIPVEPLAQAAAPKEIPVEPFAQAGKEGVRPAPTVDNTLRAQFNEAKAATEAAKKTATEAAGKAATEAAGAAEIPAAEAAGAAGTAGAAEIPAAGAAEKTAAGAIAKKAAPSLLRSAVGGLARTVTPLYLGWLGSQYLPNIVENSDIAVHAKGLKGDIKERRNAARQLTEMHEAELLKADQVRQLANNASIEDVNAIYNQYTTGDTGTKPAEGVTLKEKIAEKKAPDVVTPETEKELTPEEQELEAKENVSVADEALKADENAPHYITQDGVNTGVAFGPKRVDYIEASQPGTFKGGAERVMQGLKEGRYKLTPDTQEEIAAAKAKSNENIAAMDARSKELNDAWAARDAAVAQDRKEQLVQDRINGLEYRLKLNPNNADRNTLRALYGLQNQNQVATAQNATTLAGEKMRLASTQNIAHNAAEQHARDQNSLNAYRVAKLGIQAAGKGAAGKGKVEPEVKGIAENAKVMNKKGVILTQPGVAQAEIDAEIAKKEPGHWYESNKSTEEKRAALRPETEKAYRKKYPIAGEEEVPNVGDTRINPTTGQEEGFGSRIVNGVEQRAWVPVIRNKAK